MDQIPGKPLFLPNPGINDFRDPKVFWYEPEGKWIMVVSANDGLKFIPHQI
ncbi:MAG: hypothetical protein IPF54_27880 [Draconibacterium sp.]|nr:hypothetical protein [Draconibacterium sp.]